MTHTDLVADAPSTAVRILQHTEACRKLNLSSAKLFDMVARGQFPRPFSIVPGGRAVGWLEGDVDAWILARRADQDGAAQ